MTNNSNRRPVSITNSRNYRSEQLSRLPTPNYIRRTSSSQFRNFIATPGFELTSPGLVNIAIWRRNNVRSHLFYYLRQVSGGYLAARRHVTLFTRKKRVQPRLPSSPNVRQLKNKRPSSACFACAAEL